MLTPEEAIRRVDEIVLMSARDFRAAEQTYVVWKSSNDIIAFQMKDVKGKNAFSFNVIQHSLLMKLALDVARIFDHSDIVRHPMAEQDKASIPVLAALIEISDVKAELLSRAAKSTQTTISVNSEIANILGVWKKFEVPNSAEKSGLKRLKEFRTKRLAHALFDSEPDQLPTPYDIILLLDNARKVVRSACKIIFLVDWNDEQSKDAEDFCFKVLDALKN